MSKLKNISLILGTLTGATAIVAKVMKNKAEKTTYEANAVEPIMKREMGFYEEHIKRGVDIVCATGAIIVFSPLYVSIAMLVKLKLGSPVLFTQDRPGIIGPDGKETVFKMYKFRTMTDERDEYGELLPDEKRLTKFGKWLRKTSLDELPEAFNILNGTMSVIGPRPQLVRDMVFMSKEQRQRHTAKPGLSGLAQVNGRNSISWEDKFIWDLKYINKVGLMEDLSIILNTIKKAFIKQEGITQDDMATAEDYGDYLLRTNKISNQVYKECQTLAKQIVDNKKTEIKAANVEYPPFSVAMSVYKNDNPTFFERALQSITVEQTIMPNEIVLVVDGPVPKEIDNVISTFESKYTFFNVIRLPNNGGLGNALKIAVEKSKNQLVARMDSDDVSLPDRFEQQLRYFCEEPILDVVGGDITEFIDKEDNIVGKRVVPKSNSEIRNYMKYRCAMNHVSVMYKKDAILDVGGYKDWFWNEDYFLWIRMWLNNAVFANTGTTLVNVRVGDEMYQRRGGRRYFNSEKALQDYMLSNGMISKNIYYRNVVKRAIVQLMLPNNIRGLVFRKLARSKN